MREVILRAVDSGRIRSLLMAYEVERTDQHVVLFLPLGAPGLKRGGPRLGPRDGLLSQTAWDSEMVPKAWRGKDVLMVHRFGDPWSCWRWLDPDGGWHPGTYVNLEDPWRAGDLYYDSDDLTLDVVIEPDGSVRMKDEHELAWAEEHGVYTPERAATIRSYGERAAAHARAAGWPLAEDWSRWRPTGTPGPLCIPDWAMHAPVLPVRA